MKHVFLALKGVLFGIANLIPGLSGGTIAVITGVYEKLLDSINNLFKEFKKSILFLGIFGLGCVIAILAGAKGMDYLLKYFELPITLLFAGLIVGSLKTVKEPIKGKLDKKAIIIMCITLSIVIGLLFIPFSKATGSSLKFYDYILLFICGILASVAMVVPGISGMMMFYLFGYYDVLMGALSSLTQSFGSSVLILIPVGIGIIIGLFSAAKIISYLLKKFPIYTFAGIFGFVIGSIFALLYEGGFVGFIIDFFRTDNLSAFLNRYDYGAIFPIWASFVIGVMFFFMGWLISDFLIRMSNKNKGEIKKPTEEELRQIVEEEIKNELKLSSDELFESLSKPKDDIDEAKDDE